MDKKYLIKTMYYRDCVIAIDVDTEMPSNGFLYLWTGVYRGSMSVIYRIPTYKVTTQVFRLKAEGYKSSRKARIKPFKTFSVPTPKSLQSSVYLPE